MLTVITAITTILLIDANAIGLMTSTTSATATDTDSTRDYSGVILLLLVWHVSTTSFILFILIVSCAQEHKWCNKSTDQQLVAEMLQETLQKRRCQLANNGMEIWF